MYLLMIQLTNFLSNPIFFNNFSGYWYKMIYETEWHLGSWNSKHLNSKLELMINFFYNENIVFVVHSLISWMGKTKKIILLHQLYSE